MPNKTPDSSTMAEAKRTGHIVLTRKSGWRTWKEYFELRDAAGGAVPDDFMADRPLNVPFVKALQKATTTPNTLNLSPLKSRRKQVTGFSVPSTSIVE